MRQNVGNDVRIDEAKEYGLSVIKGATGAIPLYGPLLIEVSFEARSRLKQKRVNSFVREFSKYLEKNSSIHISRDDIKTDEFGDVFEEIIISVSKTSSDQKRDVFKKILASQMSSSCVSADTAQRYISITNQISELQFLILAEFSKLSDSVLTGC